MEFSLKLSEYVCYTIIVATVLVVSIKTWSSRKG